MDQPPTPPPVSTRSAGAIAAGRRPRSLPPGTVRTPGFPPALALVLVVLAVVACASGCRRAEPPAVDEATAAGKTAADFPQSDADAFPGIDGGIELTPEELAGRNTWVVWTAGNQSFWDEVAGKSYGAFDLLKILSSRPGQRSRRENRFETLGVVNQPGFVQATAPGKYGLWLDVPAPPSPSAPPGSGEPFDRDIYGRASGIVGLRLYPNPAFDQKAEAHWDPERYFDDPDYFLDPALVRPYRVGMACGFCHVAPSPIAPPADPENPRWSELSTTTGNQYLRPGRIFANLLEDDDFVWHAFNAMPPGTVDTSLLATDNVLNPRVMNAIHDLPARLAVAHEEELADGNLALPGTAPRMPVPHVLKDGADSVGVAGALARVYVSIGAFHQEWLRHFGLLVGGKPQTPFPVAGAAERSAYWAATLDRLDNLAKFFLRVTADRRGHHHLEDAPGGARYLPDDPEQLRRGKIVFAEHCAGCHSSKRPPAELEHGTEAYDVWMRRSVLAPDFRDHNFLSNERRNPVTKIGTNACSPLASNAMRGHVWNDFSSETYKTLPAVGPIEVDNPFTGDTETVEMPGGGRGYIRTPSLVGIWATAPYLQNNSVGRFNADPSVEGRMAAFDDGIRKMLWPERREDDTCRKEWGMPFCGPIYRTTRESELVVRAAFLPELSAGSWRRDGGRGAPHRADPGGHTGGAPGRSRHQADHRQRQDLRRDPDPPTPESEDDRRRGPRPRRRPRRAAQARPGAPIPLHLPRLQSGPRPSLRRRPAGRGQGSADFLFEDVVARREAPRLWDCIELARRIAPTHVDRFSLRPPDRLLQTVGSTGSPPNPSIPFPPSGGKGTPPPGGIGGPPGPNSPLNSPAMHLLDLLAIHVLERPEAPALVDSETGARLSYRELDARVSRAVAALADRGVGPGDRVAFLADGSIELVVAHLATLRRGAIAVPINLAYTGHEIGHILGDAEPRLVIADADRRETIERVPPERRRSVEQVVSLGALTGDGREANDRDRTSRDRGDGSSPALLVYTSGTTGKSKGAVITHDNLLATVTGLVAAWAWRPDDVLLLALPLFHVHGLVVGLHTALAAGASVRLHRRFDADRVLDELTAGEGSPANRRLAKRPRTDRARPGWAQPVHARTASPSSSASRPSTSACSRRSAAAGSDRTPSARSACSAPAAPPWRRSCSRPSAKPPATRSSSATA